VAVRDFILAYCPVRVVWLFLAIAAGQAAAVSVARAQTNDLETVAHFALIRPEADAANDDDPLSPGASWLRRPKKPAETGGSAASGKKNTAKRASEKSQTRVVPLRRDRPKSETDPPKTRRRQLGW
jgi:hypothetical protein